MLFLPETFLRLPIIRLEEICTSIATIGFRILEKCGDETVETRKTILVKSLCLVFLVLLSSAHRQYYGSNDYNQRDDDKC